MAALLDPAYTVPPPGPPGPFGTMAWLRATVSRFAEGEIHARRRAQIEALLADLDPEDLRRAALRQAPTPYTPTAVLAAALGLAPHAIADRRAVATAQPGTADVVADERTVTAAPPRTADALSAVADVVADVRTVAAAYHPGTDAPGADGALARLIAALPPGDDEITAQRVALLVQGCEPMAALVRGVATPVPVTRRLDPDGNLVEIDLAPHPFGDGPRACPGRRHALALVEGVR